MNWSSLVDSIATAPTNGENIILFVSKPLDNIVGTNLITAVNKIVQNGTQVAFIVSPGPCPRCETTTIYAYKGEAGWETVVVQDPNLLKNNLPQMPFLENAFVYKLQGDAALDVTSQSKPLRVKNGQLVNGNSNFQQTAGGNFLFWLLIIVLISLILWLIFRDRKNRV